MAGQIFYKGKNGECLPMLNGEVVQKVFEGDYDEIEICQERQEGIHCINGMKGNSSLSPRSIPRKLVLRRTNGMVSVNCS